jgi:hypothetical protein
VEVEVAEVTTVMHGTLAALEVLVAAVMVLERVVKVVLVLLILAVAVADLDMDLEMVLEPEVVLESVLLLFVLMVLQIESQNNLTNSISML